MWERKLLECIYMLPEMHPAFKYEAQTNPYKSQARGTGQSIMWDHSVMTPEEIRAEQEFLRRIPRWVMVYNVVVDGGGGKGWEEEQASIESILRPLAEAEAQKRKEGKRGRIIDFRCFRNTGEAIKELQEADQFSNLVDSAMGSQPALDLISRVLWDSGIKLDHDGGTLRFALPGERM